MKDDFPRYTLRISQILLDKIGYIAENAYRLNAASHNILKKSGLLDR